jgi:hypothetical protein
MIPLGALYWDVEPVVLYKANTFIPAKITIVNNDVGTHTYLLTIVTMNGTAQVDSYSIDAGGPIVVAAGDSEELVGMLYASADTCVLTLSLINDDVPASTSVIDTIQTNLIAPGTSSSDVTLIGGGVSSNLIGTIMEVMLVMMVMKMMTGSMGSSPAKPKEAVYPQVAAGS